MVNNDSCCFAKILKVIEILQNNSNNPFCSEEGCDRPFLGPNISAICYNTRPIQFYGRNGELFSTTYTLDGETLTSNVFRVEKVNNCCCKCRILRTIADTGEIVSTNSFITINLKCMCVLRCLDDLALEGI
ncbi:MAG: hypothetical protein IKO49_04165 [Bacilli bacterium]|nr:hypothetical protein [Bacilli bacterium]